MSNFNFRYLLPICFAATLGGFVFGYDTGVISGALAALTAKFNLTAAMLGWASGCVLVGCAAGVLVAGPFSDRKGRKAALKLAAVMFVLSAIGVTVAPNIMTFVIFRIIGGLGIGIASISTPLYIAEITPAQIRGRLVAVNQIAIVGGIAASAFFNYFVSRCGGQAWLIQQGWRWMFAGAIAPAALFAWALAFIPETPRWLIEAGRRAEARAILAKIGGDPFADGEEQAIVEGLSKESGTWRELLSATMLRPLLIGSALAVLQQITGINVFMYFGATIFRGLSESSGVDAGLLEQIVINGSCMLFTVIAIATVDRWGRKPLMLVGTIGMGFSLLAMGLMAQFTHGSAGWIMAFILVYIACFGLSVGPVVWVILAEIFPTAVRGRALGVAAFFLWVADYAVTQTFPLMDAPGSWLVSHFHHAFPFYLYAFFCGILIVVMAMAVPETRGRTLEEISRSWSPEQPKRRADRRP